MQCVHCDRIVLSFRHCTMQVVLGGGDAELLAAVDQFLSRYLIGKIHVCMYRCMYVCNIALLWTVWPGCVQLHTRRDPRPRECAAGGINCGIRNRSRSQCRRRRRRPGFECFSAYIRHTCASGKLGRRFRVKSAQVLGVWLGPDRRPNREVP
jgi:hypothetical protein